MKSQWNIAILAIIFAFVSSAKGAAPPKTSGDNERCSSRNIAYLKKRATTNELPALRAYGVTLYQCELFSKELIEVALRGARLNDGELAAIYFSLLARDNELIRGLGIAAQGGETGDRLSKYWFIEAVKYHKLLSLQAVADKWKIDLIRTPDMFGQSQLAEFVYESVANMSVQNSDQAAIALHFVERYAEGASDEALLSTEENLRELILDKARTLGIREQIIVRARMQTDEVKFERKSTH